MHINDWTKVTHGYRTDEEIIDGYNIEEIDVDQLHTLTERLVDTMEDGYYVVRSTEEDFEDKPIEKIKIPKISKSEFKRLERIDIMNEWRRLINE